MRNRIKIGRWKCGKSLGGFLFPGRWNCEKPAGGFQWHQ